MHRNSLKQLHLKMISTDNIVHSKSAQIKRIQEELRRLKEINENHLNQVRQQFHTLKEPMMKTLNITTLENKLLLKEMELLHEVQRECKKDKLESQVKKLVDADVKSIVQNEVIKSASLFENLQMHQKNSRSHRSGCSLSKFRGAKSSASGEYVLDDRMTEYVADLDDVKHNQSSNMKINVQNFDFDQISHEETEGLHSKSFGTLQGTVKDKNETSILSFVQQSIQFKRPKTQSNRNGNEFKKRSRAVTATHNSTKNAQLMSQTKTHLSRDISKRYITTGRKDVFQRFRGEINRIPIKQKTPIVQT